MKKPISIEFIEQKLVVKFIKIRVTLDYRMDNKTRKILARLA